MAKVKRVNKPQSDASKQIKRINTNLKAIGVKFGTDSEQYQRAVDLVTHAFPNDTKKTKSGFMSVTNSKKTQKKEHTLNRLSSDYRLSISGIQKETARLLKIIGKKATRKEVAENVTNEVRWSDAIRQLQEQGYTDEEINEDTVNERLHLNDAFDWAIENTGEWYKLCSSNQELQRAKDMLKLKGRRKDYDEMDDIATTVEREYNKHLEDQEQKAKEVKGGKFQHGFTMQRHDNNIFSDGK